MFEEPDFRSRRWHRDIVRAFRKTMLWIVAADSELDFYKLKGLHFEKLIGRRAGQCSMRLNDQCRLIVRIETKDGKSIVIIEIVDYH